MLFPLISLLSALAATASAQAAEMPSTSSPTFTLRVCGHSVFPGKLALVYRKEDGTYVSGGWHKVTPRPEGGECQEFTRPFTKSTGFFYYLTSEAFSVHKEGAFFELKGETAFCVSEEESYEFPSNAPCRPSDIRMFKFQYDGRDVISIGFR
jgi:uncharacterized membrane protein